MKIPRCKPVMDFVPEIDFIFWVAKLDPDFIPKSNFWEKEFWIIKRKKKRVKINYLIFRFKFIN